MGCMARMERMVLGMAHSMELGMDVDMALGSNVVRSILVLGMDRSKGLDHSSSLPTAKLLQYKRTRMRNIQTIFSLITPTVCDYRTKNLNLIL
jgi:hypothetical protein